jgi:hypothetical protein
LRPEVENTKGRVFHFEPISKQTVTNSLMISRIWPVERKISREIKGLKIRLKIRQTDETCHFKRKYPRITVLPPDLSTGFVDRFFLDLAPKLDNGG